MHLNSGTFNTTLTQWIIIWDRKTLPLNCLPEFASAIIIAEISLAFRTCAEFRRIPGTWIFLNPLLPWTLQYPTHLNSGLQTSNSLKDFIYNQIVRSVHWEGNQIKWKIPETQIFLDPLNPKPWDFPQHLGSVSNRKLYSFWRALHKNRKPGKCESGDQYTQNSSQPQST